MKKIVLIVVLLITQFITSQNQKEYQKRSPNNSFIKNEGQIIDQNGKPNNKVLYLLNTNGLNVQLRKSGFSYDVYETKSNGIKSKTNNKKRIRFDDINIENKCDSISSTTSFHRIDIDFLDTNIDLKIKEHEVLMSHKNYYNLPDGKIITKVKSFKKIIYENLYNGIDVEFFVPDDIKKPVEYNFIINPDADISKIKMKISGADVDIKNNSLNISLIHGNLNEIIPESWTQDDEGAKKVDVKIEYVRKNKNVFGFKSKSGNYDNNSTLVIDPTPVREWGTYFGGYFIDGGYLGHMDHDNDGNTIYATRTNSSDNIATAGSHQTINFITSSALLPNTGLLMKFNTDGGLVWATYYGGTGITEFLDIKTDGENNIIAGGITGSESYIATPNSHQEQKANLFDGFLVKFNADGVRLWATYYGGSNGDRISSVSVNSLNDIYIAGDTNSQDGIATANSYDEQLENIGSSDGFLAKFNTDGVREWGSYYGGMGTDIINQIEVDNGGDLCIVGYTNSEDEISTVGSYKENLTLNGPQTTDRIDAFLVKFNTNGSRIWGTYFGGDAIDRGFGITTDNNKNIIISGSTQSTIEIAFNNSHQINKGGDIADWDDFLAKFSENGALIWSTYYGGSENENNDSCAVDTDSDNNIYLTGGTSSSSNISTPDSYQENFIGFENAFLVKFDELGNRIWGTYYGENQAIATDVNIFNESIYLFGITSSSTGIASADGHQTEVEFDDCFIVKLRECESFIEAGANEFLCAGDNISFTASGGINYSWSGPNGFVSIEQNPIILNANIGDSGTYSVNIESSSGCDVTKTFEILVSERPMAFPIDNIEVCEDSFSTGISSSIDTSNIESQTLGGQTDMLVSYYDSSGNPLSSPLPNPFTNSQSGFETITVRVANNNNAECYEETSFNIVINSLPVVNVINNIYSCDDDYDGISVFDISNIENIILGEQAGITIDFFYENGLQLPNPLPASILNTIPNQETITARITNPNTNCFNEISFDLIVNPLPVANSINILYGCDDNNDGISEYFDTSNVENEVLNGQTAMAVSYFDQNENELSSPLPNPFININPFNELITVRVTDINSNCYVETALQLQTVTQPNINQPDNLYACDQGNGYAEFETSNIEQQIIGSQIGLTLQYYDSNNNPLPSPLPVLFQNAEPFSQTINVRVEDASNPICYSETSFDLIVNELPEINLEEEYFICNLEPSFLLSINLGFNSYNWFFEDGTLISDTNSAEITEEGSYTLIVTQMDNGITCENSFVFNLTRSVLPEIQQVNYGELGNNYIEIIASGDGNFEYSIDDVNYQDSNYFSNIQGGIYTVFVRDKDGCGEDSDEVIIIDYPKFFTPNNDGYNDFWQIKGISEFPNSKILIFDRYGKLLTQLTSNNFGWNGLYNGKKMMSNDYWFRANLGNGQVFSGHFSLKR
jgi:gliding motility-associated-like protein